MILTFIVFLAVLSLLVLVHELGHFLMAKKLGIKIEEFGFGLPPRIFGVKRGETVYSINWLPIGGFVKLYGEDEAGTHNPELLASKQNKAFFAKSKKARALVLVSGVTMNFLLAILVISYIFTQGVLIPTDKVYVKEISAGSPAEVAGLKINDRIFLVNDEKITAISQFQELTKKNLGREISIEVTRSVDNPCPLNPKVLGGYPGIKISCRGENPVFSLTPRVSPPQGEGPLGVAISNLEEKKYPLWQAPFLGTQEAVRLSGMMFFELGKILFNLITFKPVTAEVAGPLGIAQATGEAVKFGWMAVLQLVGLLSLNLAVINILPFPALDGGRLLFIALEALTKKRVNPKWEMWAHQTGMAILLGLVALVTINDVLRIFRR
ncbi:MAG: RIP metalloprotease [Patescibacteria group bacterium]|nr:RIP metalloprotease [Patescibacteria group bacterium]MCL5095833.1 RIP metalloprotease [Patescibacteria group bacterium]